MDAALNLKMDKQKSENKTDPLVCAFAKYAGGNGAVALAG